MKTKINNKSAFTVIELVLTIAIIGTLVLLAIPKFIDYKEDTSTINVKNDVSVLQKTIAENMTNNQNYVHQFTKVDNQKMKSMKQYLFNLDGLIQKNNDVTFNDSTYYKVKKEDNLIKTSLDGEFYFSKDGVVFYYDGKLANKLYKSHPEYNPEPQRKPTDIELGMTNDFEWIPGSVGYIGLNGKKGYFHYIGKGKSSVEVPHVIQGVSINSYYNMFKDAPEELKKVVSTNSGVVTMYGTFNGAKSTTLDLSKFDTSSVRNMGYMFEYAKATHLDLSGFDTSKATAMNQMFQYAETTSVDLSSFNTSNVTNMSYMFNKNKIEILDLSTFDTSNVTNMRGIFQYFPGSNIDLSSFDMTNVTNTDFMFQYSNLVTGAAKSKLDADKLLKSLNKPTALKFAVR